jgi:phage gpG-like protein
MTNDDGGGIRITGITEVRKMLKELFQKTGDVSKPLADWGEYKLLALREQWDREENPFGQKWKPLSPKTIAEKRRKRKMRGILTRDLLLRDSFVYATTKDSLRLGTDIRYAGYHQFGKGVPKRQILGVNDVDLQELKATITEYLPIN